MNVYRLKYRSLTSTWMSAVFLLSLLSYLFFIEYFLDIKRNDKTIDLLESPIRIDVLKNLTSMKFKNRIGSFTIKKSQESWELEEPRVMPAKVETINKILDSLKTIKVQTVHQHEPINFQSFSLDKPVIEIELLTKLYDKVIIKVGLINSINNTSYITVSGHNRIYQASFTNANMQSFGLSDFIDSHIFSLKLNEISKISLYQGKSSTASVIVENSGDLWKINKYNTIDQTKLARVLKQLLEIKTHMIVDKKDENLQTFINNYIQNPKLHLKLKDKDGKIIEYFVSYPIKAIPELKIEKKQYFLITASDRPHPYIINKDFYEAFNFKYQDIKP